MSGAVTLGCLAFALFVVLANLSRIARLGIAAGAILIALAFIFLPTVGADSAVTPYVVGCIAVIGISAGLFELIATLSRKLTKRAAHG